MIIPIAPSNTAPPLLEDTGRIKPRTRLEASERPGLQKFACNGGEVRLSKSEKRDQVYQLRYP